MNRNFLTGSTAALYANNARIGKCRNFTLITTRQKNRTTKLGDWDETFTVGLRDTTATADIFYSEEDEVARTVMSSIYENNTNTIPLKILFDIYTGKKVAGPVFVEQQSIPIAFGSAMVCSVQIQFSGKPEVLF